VKFLLAGLIAFVVSFVIGMIPVAKQMLFTYCLCGSIVLTAFGIVDLIAAYFQKRKKKNAGP
jgi:uncharacterized membrane protein HdeD (DUF308 family)